MALDERAFATLADETLARIAERIEAADDDLEVDLEGSVLQIETPSGEIFVLNKHAPLCQLWLSSPMSGASHYAWDAARAGWFSTRGGAALGTVLSGDLSSVAGLDVSFD